MPLNSFRGTYPNCTQACFYLQCSAGRSCYYNVEFAGSAATYAVRSNIYAALPLAASDSYLREWRGFVDSTLTDEISINPNGGNTMPRQPIEENVLRTFYCNNCGLEEQRVNAQRHRDLHTDCTQCVAELARSAGITAQQQVDGSVLTADSTFYRSHRRCRAQGCEPHFSCASCARTLNTRSVRKCPICLKCGRCCTCNYCGRCSRNGRSICQEHSLPITARVGAGSETICRACCACAKGFQFWKPSDGVVFHHGSNRRVRTKRYISAEIELDAINGIGPNHEGDTMMSVVKKWKSAVVSDGSVGACEINTAPASGDKWEEQITQICETLKNQKAEAGLSCGLHVHVDARDFNFYDVRRLVYLYRHVERGLFALCHPARTKSRYSIPCAHKLARDIDKAKIPKEAKKNFFKNVYGSEATRDLNRASLSRNKYNESRYNALNLHSWIFRGTIENRMHHGTVQFENIFYWGLLNASILDFAYAKPESYIKDMRKHDTEDEDVYTTVPKQEMDGSIAALLEVCSSFKLKDWVQKKYEKMLPYHVGTKNVFDLSDPDL